MEEGRDVLEIGVGLGISAGTRAAGPAAGIALAEVYVLYAGQSAFQSAMGVVNDHALKKREKVCVPGGWLAAAASGTSSAKTAAKPAFKCQSRYDKR